MLSLATLCAPVVLAQSANQAGPGSMNYIEGSVSVNDRPLTNQSIGSVVLQPGQILQTANGKAEMLLTPGVFLRLGDNSAVKMISPSLTNTQVELDHGRAAIEVDEIHSENNIQVSESGADTRLLKDGFYEFDADNSTIRVFKGQAEVTENRGDNPKPIKVKGDHELVLTEAKLKPADFDPKSVEDDLYNWSSLRSKYLAEANANLAEQYAGYPSFAPGWYWNPAIWGYTWLPGDGMFWSPFGWGFYSPIYVYRFGPIYHVRSWGWDHNNHHGYPRQVIVPPAHGFHESPGGSHEGFHDGGLRSGMMGGFHSGGIRR